jgi:hypothetical protein
MNHIHTQGTQAAGGPEALQLVDAPPQAPAPVSPASDVDVAAAPKHEEMPAPADMPKPTVRNG